MLIERTVGVPTLILHGPAKRLRLGTKTGKGLAHCPNVESMGADRRRNVVLVVLDTVRKDVFDDVATRLTGCADVSCPAYYVPSSWTVPSHASMFTGRLPHQHGVHAYTGGFSSLTREETFLADLDAHYCSAVSANNNASSAKAYDTLFDSFTDVQFNREGLLPGGVHIGDFKRASDRDGVSLYLEFLYTALVQGETIPSLLNGATAVSLDVVGKRPPIPRFADYGARDIATEALDVVDREPFFLYANYMEAHLPHAVVTDYDSSLHSVPSWWSSNRVTNWEFNTAADHEDYAQYLDRFRQLYTASIEYLDRQVRQLCASIRDRTDLETTIVVTSDHGENLGYPAEGRTIGHNVGSLTDSLVHVPFLVINPPDGGLPDRLSGLDLGEILTSYADGQTPALDRSVLPAERIGLAGRAANRDVEGFEYWDRGRRCVVDGERTYRWDTLGNATVQDASGTRDVDVDSLPAHVVEPFDEPIAEYKASLEDGGELDEETRSHLEDLGYV
jgi:arylsulfatase A-like enzyme